MSSLGVCLMHEGIDIALQYFNSGRADTIHELTKRATAWQKRYNGQYPKVAPNDFLDIFPHAFNFDVDGGLRLLPDKMDSPVARSREPSPALASDEEVDKIVDLRRRCPHPSEGRAKPEMRVNAGMLRCSGLLDRLPEFLDELAKANAETEAELANNPSGSGFELDDKEAENQPHISMDVFAGLLKPGHRRRRRHDRGLALPADLDSADDGDQSSDQESPAFAAKKRKASDMDERLASPALSAKSISSVSSGGPTRIIRIKIPESLRSSSQSCDNSTDSSPSTQGRRIIRLKSPTKKPMVPASATAPPAMPTERRPSPRIVIKRDESDALSPALLESDSSQGSQNKIRLIVRYSSQEAAERPSKRRRRHPPRGSGETFQALVQHEAQSGESDA